MISMKRATRIIGSTVFTSNSLPNASAIQGRTILFSFKESTDNFRFKGRQEFEDYTYSSMDPHAAADEKKKSYCT